jgi:hypothetical protein
MLTLDIISFIYGIIIRRNKQIDIMESAIKCSANVSALGVNLREQTEGLCRRCMKQYSINHE